MAEIIFSEIAFGTTKELQEKIRNRQLEFNNELIQNPELNSFKGKLFLTNKGEFDLTKFCLQSVEPESEFNSVLSILQREFLEYLGDNRLIILILLIHVSVYFITNP